MIAKYLTSVPWKNICIICDFHHDLSKILNHFIMIHIFQFYLSMIFAIFFYITQNLIQIITHQTTKSLDYF